MHVHHLFKHESRFSLRLVMMQATVILHVSIIGLVEGSGFVSSRPWLSFMQYSHLIF